jgi:hypothetical protein
VEESGEGGGAADQVTGSHGQAVLVAFPKLIEHRRQVFTTAGGNAVCGTRSVRVEVTVVVVESEQLELHELAGRISFLARCRARQKGQRGKCQS